MARHRVAQVGVGARGKIHADALLQLSDRFELVGLCDIDAGRLRAYAAAKGLPDGVLYADAERMLAETRPEVFCFATLPDLRLPMVELGVRHGVVGLSFEKPMANSLREAWAIARLCRDHGIRGVVSHQHKYLTSFQECRRLLDSGALGRLERVEATCQAWLGQLGTHYMDYVLWANGGSRAKWAVGHVHGRELLADSHPSPNYTMGHVEFENGVRAWFEFGRLSASHMARGKFWLDDRLTLYCSRGHAWADADGRWGAVASETLGGQGPTWAEQEPTRLQPLYYAELADWLDGAVDRHSCDVQMAYHGYEILNAVCLSALDHVRVDLPLDPLSVPDVFARMRRELPECPEREE